MWSNSSVSLIFQISSITNLTLFGCTCRDLSQLLGYASMLKYLNARKICNGYLWTNYYTCFSNTPAVHLKQLIMTDFSEEFKNIEILVKQTSNLKSLMVSSFWTEDIIDAVRWEELITSSLPQLTVFKFQFSYRFRSSEKDTILGKFEKFQSDFWREQHRWCVEYSSDSNPPTIYTLPYMLNTADYNYLPKKSKPFDNITHLDVYLLEMRKKFQHHLKNVTKLELCMNFSRKQNSNVSLRREHFQYLKRIVNLSNIKHLTLSDEYMLLLIHILYYTQREIF
jgi:hypothetical protein